MSLYDPTTQALLRAVQESALPDVCDILRPAAAKNEIGEDVETFGTVGVGVPCRFMRITRGYDESEAVEAGAEVAAPDGRFTFAVGVDIQETDRIRFDGDTYEIVAVHRSGAYMTALRVDVRRAT